MPTTTIGSPIMGSDIVRVSIRALTTTATKREINHNNNFLVFSSSMSAPYDGIRVLLCLHFGHQRIFGKICIKDDIQDLFLR